MGNRTDIDPDHIRAKLFALREELLRNEESSRDSRRPVELDQTAVGRLSRMDALQDQAVALELERRRKVELKQIDAALARMDEGEYGYCLNCGEEISAKRLELDPTAPLCIGCARQSS